MSSMLLCVAAVNSSSAFPGARCVASRTRPLKCTRPSPSAAKDRGTAAPHPGDADPFLGRVLRQPQLPHAVIEHRGERRGEVELAEVELRDMRQQVRGSFVLGRGGSGQLPTERLVGQVRQRVVLHVTLDGGGWSRADAGILHRTKSAPTDARTGRDRRAAHNFLGADPRRPQASAQGIVVRHRAQGVERDDRRIDSRQFKSM